MSDGQRSKLHRPWCLQKAHDPLAFESGDPVLSDPEVVAEVLAATSPCPCRAVSPDMPFIRLSWLLDEGTELQNAPSMQELEDNAFIPQDDMEQVYFVSHRWLDRDHPDRSGRQLAVAISQMWCDGNQNFPHWYPEKWQEAHKVGVWYDYPTMTRITLPIGK